MRKIKVKKKFEMNERIGLNNQMRDFSNMDKKCKKKIQFHHYTKSVLIDP